MSRESRPRFSVQAFRTKGKGKGLEPEPIQSAADEAQALRLVERAARGRAGAVAVRQNGDPEMGDFEEPVVLKVIGRVPAIFLDLPF